MELNLIMKSHILLIKTISVNLFSFKERTSKIPNDLHYSEKYKGKKGKKVVKEVIFGISLIISRSLFLMNLQKWVLHHIE
jgi:hypothetical protein